MLERDFVSLLSIFIGLAVLSIAGCIHCRSHGVFSCLKAIAEEYELNKKDMDHVEGI